MHIKLIPLKLIKNIEDDTVNSNSKFGRLVPQFIRFNILNLKLSAIYVQFDYNKSISIFNIEDCIHPNKLTSVSS